MCWAPPLAFAVRRDLRWRCSDGEVIGSDAAWAYKSNTKVQQPDAGIRFWELDRFKPTRGAAAGCRVGFQRKSDEGRSKHPGQ